MKSLFINICLMLPFLALAQGPCKDKVESKHKARRELHSCVESWAKDNKPGDADPSDDCSAKLATFISDAKALKACRMEHKK